MRQTIMKDLFVYLDLFCHNCGLVLLGCNMRANIRVSGDGYDPVHDLYDRVDESTNSVSRVV